MNSFAGIYLDTFAAVLLGGTFLAGLIIALVLRWLSKFRGKTIGMIAGLSQWALPLGLLAFDILRRGWENAVFWEPLNTFIQLTLLFGIGWFGAFVGLYLIGRFFPRADHSVASTFE